MPYKFSQKSLDRLEGVHPDLVRLAHKAIEISKVDFGISQGRRTLEEQKNLYAQGRTEPGKIVTWTMNSKHLPQKDGYGHAIDIACYIDGKLSWDDKYYVEVSKYFEQAGRILGIKYTWGGSWGTPDKPHYEV